MVRIHRPGDQGVEMAGAPLTIVSCDPYAAFFSPPPSMTLGPTGLELLVPKEEFHRGHGRGYTKVET